MVETSRLDIAIEANRLCFSYDDSKVIDNLSFTLKKGKRLAILGKSGCGKSTLLKVISALILPNSGRLKLRGQIYYDDSDWVYETWEIRQKIVMVFQSYNLFPNYTVLKNITLALRVVKGYDEKKAVEAANDIAHKLCIEDVIDKYPNQISGGQAQRVALARAYVMCPSIMLLDEVTSAIDPTTINNVIKILEELKHSDETIDTSVVLVTHNLKFAIDYSDYIAFMSDGKFVDFAESKKFLSSSSHIQTLSYIDDSKYYI